jgi:2-polyprenyl-6-methoxyphenol hydroxylase-like FAD-dependent oxidoreductase
MTDVAGKTAFITGGASGLGLATAKALAAKGASVILADIDAAGAENAAAELRSEGTNALGLQLDVTSEDSWAEAGAKARFGTTFATLAQDAAGVDVTFSDGSTGRYDLVVGADGVNSWTRRALGIDLGTRPVGMGIWRAFGPRPAVVTRTDLYYGGPSYIAGYCPTGPDTLYAYVVEKAQDRFSLTSSEKLSIIRELAAAYHGPWDEIRDSITDAATVNYTWFETHVVPAPWNRGRVVIIGDAAHVCPPTVAQGGAQALEDALVLTEVLLEHSTLDDQLWQEFMDRRFDRASEVVEASLQLGRWLQDGVRGDVPGLMHRVATLVQAQP